MSGQAVKFFADESCDFAAVRALREAGYDVAAAVEIMPGASDQRILELAAKEQCILLTEDKDFGEWVFSHGRRTNGIVLIRFPGGQRSKMTEALLQIILEHETELSQSYVVLEPGRARIRSI